MASAWLACATNGVLPPATSGAAASTCVMRPSDQKHEPATSRSECVRAWGASARGAARPDLAQRCDLARDGGGQTARPLGGVAHRDVQPNLRIARAPARYLQHSLQLHTMRFLLTGPESESLVVSSGCTKGNALASATARASSYRAACGTSQTAALRPITCWRLGVNESIGRAANVIESYERQKWSGMTRVYVAPAGCPRGAQPRARCRRPVPGAAMDENVIPCRPPYTAKRIPNATGGVCRTVAPRPRLAW